jgi:hypothetical protein
MDGAAARLTMERPVACAIRVQGALAPAWSDRLEGLRITRVDGPRAGAAATTELRGELAGQAAVLRVLGTLHAQGQSLLSVRCAPAGRPAGDGAIGGADR